jgi:uncharacterized protein YceK
LLAQSITSRHHPHGERSNHRRQMRAVIASLIGMVLTCSGSATLIAKNGISDPPAPTGHFAGTQLDAWLLRAGIATGELGVLAFFIPALIDLPMSFVTDILFYPFERPAGDSSLTKGPRPSDASFSSSDNQRTVWKSNPRPE